MSSAMKAIPWLTVGGAIAVTLTTGLVVLGAAVLAAGGTALVAGILLKSRLERQVGELPADIKMHLKSTFQMSEDSLSGLRYVAKQGRFSGAPVRLVRVFDPSRLLRSADVKKFKDVDTEGASIQFDSHIFSDAPRSISLADVR